MKSCVVTVYRIVDAVIVLVRTNRTKRAWTGFRGMWPWLTSTASPAFVWGAWRKLRTSIRIPCPLTPTFETSITETHVYDVTDKPASSVSATGEGPEKNTETSSLTPAPEVPGNKHVTNLCSRIDKTRLTRTLVSAKRQICPTFAFFIRPVRKTAKSNY
jgi:hypothetical protein